jgi:hypothetical protein
MSVEIMFQKVSSPYLKNALDHHLYISIANDSSLSVLCYDNVLCYLSNVIDHGSINEIELNLKRYFTCEQIEQAYLNLQNSLHYSLSIPNLNLDNHHTRKIFEECINNLTNSSCLLSIIEIISSKNLFSYLPIFVTNDWIHMIRHIQQLKNIDTPSSIRNLQEKMIDLKENLLSLHQLVDNIQTFPSVSPTMESSISPDPCCLRTYCQHTSNPRLTPMIDSPPSSWSSIEVDKNPLITFNRTNPGFIRNPVTNFLMPTAPIINEFTSTIDDNQSSDDEQSINSKISSMVVRRNDDLWIYPIGIDIRKSKLNPKEYSRSQSLFNPLNEIKDQTNLFLRSQSFYDDDFSGENFDKFQQPQLKKHKKGKG